MILTMTARRVAGDIADEPNRLSIYGFRFSMMIDAAITPLAPALPRAPGPLCALFSAVSLPAAFKDGHDHMPRVRDFRPAGELLR